MEPILQGHPSVDEVIALGLDAGFGALAQAIRQFAPDVFLNLHPKPQPLLAAWWAKVPVRIGERYRWHGFFQTHTVLIQRAVSDRNEVEYNFELLRPLGVTQFTDHIDFPLSQSQKDWNKSFLTEKGVEGPYVVVHPGAKSQVLHWKAERFGQLIGHLCQIENLKVVVTAGPQDGPLIGEATSFLFALPKDERPIQVNTGALNFHQFAAICHGALCVVGGPLGPMSLAAAVGTPTVTLFSPAPEATPIRWGAWGNDHKDLIPQNAVCMACRVGYCKKHDPMDALSVAEVLEAIKPYIRKVLAV
jgi:ADP-heptose:LPS heptosyltransferase